MAIGLREWNVLQHKPIEKLASNLWRVEGRMSETNWRVMLLVRLGDGRIVMHNAIALDEPSMREIDEWGEVASILIPNRFHRQDAFVMQQRYVKARVYAPRGAYARTKAVRAGCVASHIAAALASFLVLYLLLAHELLPLISEYSQLGYVSLVVRLYLPAFVVEIEVTAVKRR